MKIDTGRVEDFSNLLMNTDSELSDPNNSFEHFESI